MNRDGSTDVFQLTGQVVLVTGGAQGLGFAIARAFAHQGAQVVLADIQSKTLSEAVERLRQEGARCFGVTMDVTDEVSVAQEMEAIVQRENHLDIVVNNAGIVERAPAEDMTLSQWRRIMAVNLDGVFLVSKHAARAMMRLKRGGSIINMASMSGFVVNVPMKQAAYNTSKSAVAMLTKSCAVEWASERIRVNAIAPGYMATDMTGSDFERGGPYHALIDRIPLGRLGHPAELGGVALWLGSQASSYVTGAIIPVDGGYMLP